MAERQRLLEWISGDGEDYRYHPHFAVFTEARQGLTALVDDGLICARGVAVHGRGPIFGDYEVTQKGRQVLARLRNKAEDGSFSSLS